MSKNKKIIIYGHAGSYNHGAEAITNSTIKLLKTIIPKSKIILSTHFADQDREFLTDVDKIIERNIMGVTNEEIYEETIAQIDSNSICIHVGGDNYCYNNWQRYALIHEKAIQRGAISILWGCSIDPEKIDSEMLAVLKTHSLITVRENISYNAMLDYGLNNIVKVTDIAFGLEPQKVEFYWDNFVAVNISPLVIKENPLLINAITHLINFITNNTDMNVLLIPHCLVSVNNDCDSLKQINFGGSDRVKIITENLSAGQYKTIIAQARFGIFARTHASIAAYSSLVPTLALGYSVKSRGIAFDLDLTDYVVDIKSIKAETDLLAPFNKLFENESIIKNKLKDKIPAYVNNIINTQLLEWVGGK